MQTWGSGRSCSPTGLPLPATRRTLRRRRLPGAMAGTRREGRGVARAGGKRGRGEGVAET